MADKIQVFDEHSMERISKVVQWGESHMGGPPHPTPPPRMIPYQHRRFRLITDIDPFDEISSAVRGLLSASDLEEIESGTVKGVGIAIHLRRINGVLTTGETFTLVDLIGTYTGGAATSTTDAAEGWCIHPHDRDWWEISELKQAGGDTPLLVAAVFSAVDQGTSTGSHLGIAQIPFVSGDFPRKLPSSVVGAMELDGNGTVTESGGALLFTTPGIYSFQTSISYTLSMPINPDGQDGPESGYRVRMRIGPTPAKHYLYAVGDECIISSPPNIATGNSNLDWHSHDPDTLPASSGASYSYCMEGIRMADGDPYHGWVMRETRSCGGYFLIHPDLVPCELEYTQEGTFNDDNPKTGSNTMAGELMAKWVAPWTGTWTP